MIDLAGSERDSKEDSTESSVGVADSSRSNTPSKSTAQSELKSIRKSLSSLGYIIKALNKGVSSAVMPYRDSTLTYLLKGILIFIIRSLIISVDY